MPRSFRIHESPQVGLRIIFVTYSSLSSAQRTWGSGSRERSINSILFLYLKSDWYWVQFSAVLIFCIFIPKLDNSWQSPSLCFASERTPSVQTSVLGSRLFFHGPPSVPAMGFFCCDSGLVAIRVRQQRWPLSRAALTGLSEIYVLPHLLVAILFSSMQNSSVRLLVGRVATPPLCVQFPMIWV